MNSRTTLLLAVAGGFAVGGVLVLNHHKPSTPNSNAPGISAAGTPVDEAGGRLSTSAAPPSSPATGTPALTPQDRPPGTVTPLPPAERGFGPSARAGKAARRAIPPASPPAAALEPPMAREALSLVGIDAAAEAVWADSINDPTVPAEARKNLIEDLNEDGFPDPKHVTPDDVPLIITRMQMIEQYAPAALDDVNAAAFEEAYKDLENMLAKATGA